MCKSLNYWFNRHFTQLFRGFYVIHTYGIIWIWYKLLLGFFCFSPFFIFTLPSHLFHTRNSVISINTDDKHLLDIRQLVTLQEWRIGILDIYHDVYHTYLGHFKKCSFQKSDLNPCLHSETINPTYCIWMKLPWIWCLRPLLHTDL